MITRYMREEMGQIWSDANRFRKWLEVEVEVLWVRWERGEIKGELPADFDDFIQKIVIDPAEINRIEAKKTKHDVLAFLEHVSPQFPENLRPWLHRGMTSYDVVDTALMLVLREAFGLIIEGTENLMEVIKKRAFEFKTTPMIGRTHGVHAEPITFGVRLANWYAELDRQLDRLEQARRMAAVGKISGAVGMYTLPPEVEEKTLAMLEMDPVISTQIISRDIISEVMSVLANLAATISKIALNLRLGARAEVRETMEFFDVHQKGSSAMPHKKNPIGSENLCGLMRQVISNLQAVFWTQADCWEERSLDNSGIERVVLPDSTTLVDYALDRLTKIISKMLVYPDKMHRNLELTKGLIFSQDVMMLVAEKSGLPREEAHTLVRDIAIECWEKEYDFLKALLANETIMKHVAEEELRACFDLNRKLQHVDHIFKTVFGE